MGVPGNALSIRALYWRKMSQNIGDIHILWAFNWLNDFDLKPVDASFTPQYVFLMKSICIMPQTTLHRSIFSMFLTDKLNRERQGNRYAASLRPETVTILRRANHVHQIQRKLKSFLLSLQARLERRPSSIDPLANRWLGAWHNRIIFDGLLSSWYIQCYLRPIYSQFTFNKFTIWGAPISHCQARMLQWQTGSEC